MSANDGSLPCHYHRSRNSVFTAYRAPYCPSSVRKARYLLPRTSRYGSTNIGDGKKRTRFRYYRTYKSPQFSPAAFRCHSNQRTSHSRSPAYAHGDGCRSRYNGSGFIYLLTECRRNDLCAYGSLAYDGSLLLFYSGRAFSEPAYFQFGKSPSHDNACETSASRQNGNSDAAYTVSHRVRVSSSRH